MAKIEVTGYFDTETGELIIEAPKPPAKRGRKPNPQGKNAVLILVDAWATSNFTATASQKPRRIRDALGIQNLTDAGSLRTAIRNAKKCADTLFPAPHKPGEIIYGRGGRFGFPTERRAINVKAKQRFSVMRGYGGRDLARPSIP